MKPRAVHVHTQILSELAGRRQLKGREHLVAPFVLVQEMVLGEGDAAELLTFGALEDAAARSLWEGRPVVTPDHPTNAEGQLISASLVDVSDIYQIGELHNVKIDRDERALTGEVWIDIELAERAPTGQELIDAIENWEEGEDRVEGSTMYWATTHPGPGTFEGQAYTGQQLLMGPDHYALLPAGRGKCSVEDGCGGPRIVANAEQIERLRPAAPMVDADSNVFRRMMDRLSTGIAETIRKAIGTQDVSHEDLEQQLRAEIAEVESPGDNFIFIPSVFDDRVVYQVGEGEFWERDYTLDGDGNVTLGEERTEVTRRTIWEPVAQSAGETGGDPNVEDNMTREESITLLAACEACPFDAEGLKALSDEQLTYLVKQSQASGEGASSDGTGAGEGAGADGAAAPDGTEGTDDGKAPVVPAASPLAFSEADRAVLDAFEGIKPVDIAGAVASVKAQAEEEAAKKTALVAKLVANDRNRMTEADLVTLSLKALGDYEVSLQPTSYFGAGVVRIGSGAEGDGETAFDRQRVLAVENAKRGNIILRHRPLKGGD